MTDKPHILIVDDDPRIRQMLSRYLSDEGFRVSEAKDGAVLREYLMRGGIDLILLDLVMPGEDGIKLARDIRSASSVAIIMLTGRSDMIDKVVGLEVGADDYIAKPFHLREVLARIKSVLRRTQHNVQEDSRTLVEDMLRFDGWCLDVNRRELTSPEGTEILLTTGEFDLLVAFARHPGRVLNRDALMDMTRGRHWEAFDRSIDAQVARLRRKLERNPTKPALIKSVRGVGYVFTGRVQ